MPVLLGFIRAALRVILKWVIRFLIAQIIAWILLKTVAWLVEKYKKQIKDLITEFHNDILDDVFDLNLLLTNTQDEIYTALDSIIDQFTAKVDAIIDSVLPEQFDSLLVNIGFEGWLANISEEIAINAGQTAASVVETAIQPLITLADEIEIKVNVLVADIESLNNIINDDVQEYYDGFNQTVIDYTAAYNTNFAGLITNIHDLPNQLNIQINSIHTGFDTQEQALNQQQAAVDMAIGNMEAYLETAIPLNAVITDAASIAGNAANCFDDLAIDIHPINFEKYPISLPDVSVLLIEITPPEFDLHYNIQFLSTGLSTVAAKLQQITTNLNALPGNIRNSFDGLFPDYLQNNTRDKIQILFQIALIRMIKNKRIAILNEIADAQNRLIAKRSEDAQRIVDKTQAVKDDIAAYEAQLVDRLPDIIQPVADQYLDEVEGQIVQLEDEIMVNIDQIADDILGIDHLVASFPAAIIPRVNFNKTDSVLFHINDIYRLLCNYFDRADRIALIAYLAQFDIPDDIENFLNFPK